MGFMRDQIHDAVRRVVQRHRLFAQRHAAGLDLGEVQDVIQMMVISAWPLWPDGRHHLDAEQAPGRNP